MHSDVSSRYLDRQLRLSRTCHIKWLRVDRRDRWLHPLSRRNSNMNWLDGTWFWVLCKLGVHALVASRYARFPEQRSVHSMTTSLTCPASRTKMVLSTTEASHTCLGSLNPGSACHNPSPAEALMHQSRRLRRLAGYGANSAVACVRGPTIADTTTTQ